MARTVQKLFKTPGPHPNGLQAAPDGLWSIDQHNGMVYKQAWKDGAVLFSLQTEADKASGITLGAGAIWLASTYNCRILKVDPKTGKTLASYDTPGAGVVAWRRDDPNAVRTGAHGLEWVRGRMWIATPPSQTVYQVDPTTMKVLKSFPTPGGRPHGLAWVDGYLWLADTTLKQIHRLDPRNGKVRETIDVPTPEVHGMTYYQGALWFCDDKTCEVCRIPL